jgi:hypothetical protein
MTAVRERETSVTGESATVSVPRETRVQDVPAPLPVRRCGGFGAGEQDLVAALLVHGYGRREELCAVLAGLAETKS